MTSLFDTARASRRRLLSTINYKDLSKEERRHATKMAAEIGVMVAVPHHYLGMQKKWAHHDYFERIITEMYGCIKPFIDIPRCDEWYKKIVAPSHRRTYDPRITAFVKAAQRTTDRKGE